MKPFGQYPVQKCFSGFVISLLTATLPLQSFAQPPNTETQKRSARSVSSPKRKPVARMEVSNHKNGTSSLTFSFLDVPATFEVNRIELHLQQTKPVTPVQGSPSEEVKAAYYTAQISNVVFDQADPVVTVDVRLYHNPREPYALSIVCLWYSRANSHIEFKVKPKYFNVRGEEIAITTEPQEGLVVLENRLTVNPVNWQAEPSSTAQKPTCLMQNEGKGNQP